MWESVVVLIKRDAQEQIEDTASRVDVASVHSQQLEKKIKQFDKVFGTMMIVVVMMIMMVAVAY